MTEADANRTAVLSRIRAALGVSTGEPLREAAVEDRLVHHPRGTIPVRAKANRSERLLYREVKVVKGDTETEVLGAVAMARDVTERVEQERAASRSS